MPTLEKSIKSLTRAGFVPVEGEAAKMLGTLFDGEVAAVLVAPSSRLVVAVCRIGASYVTQRPLRIPAKQPSHPAQSATHPSA